MPEHPERSGFVDQRNPLLPLDPEILDPVSAEAALSLLAAVFCSIEPSSAQPFPDPSESSNLISPEARYRSLVDQLPAVVFMVSLDRGSGDAYVSPQIEAALGFSQEEWLSDPIRWYQHIHPDDKQRWSTDAAEMFLSGEPLKSIYRVLARDSRVVWFQCEAKFMRGHDGRPYAIHGVGFDITSLKEGECSLSQKNRQLELMKDVATLANQATTIAGAMQNAVERVCQFTGWPLGHARLAALDQKHLLTSPIWNSNREPRFDAFRAASEAPEVSTGSGFLAGVIAHGRPTWIKDVASDPSFIRQAVAHQAGIKSAFAFPVLSGNEVIAVLEFFALERKEPDDALLEIMAMVGTQLGQVVERKEYDRRLEVAAQKAEDASRAKSLFLSTMSHEIRTPMNAILGYAQLMSRDPDLGTNAKANLQIIRQSGEHLLGLITDILDMSKLEAGRAELHLSTFSFSQFVESIASMFRLWAQAKALRFDVLVDGESLAYVVADEGKIRQVLINLLGNAIKFTVRGQIRLHVSLQRRLDHRLWLSSQVEDTGPGLNIEEQEKLFQPFNQFKRGLKLKEGTGLGLSIGRSYARLMGGDITLTSQPGEGSVFRFEIPVEAGDCEIDPAPQMPYNAHAAGEFVWQPDSAPAMPSTVSPDQLAKLPAEWIDELLGAVSEGEKDRLDKLIQRIEQSDKQAAAALREFAENYDYDALTHLLVTTQEKIAGPKRNQ